MVLVNLAGEGSFDRVSHAHLRLVVALDVVILGYLLLVDQLVLAAVIDVLADLGAALDLALVLAAEEGRTRVPLLHLGEVGRV